MRRLSTYLIRSNEYYVWSLRKELGKLKDLQPSANELECNAC
jgi:hypothetical protein